MMLQKLSDDCPDITVRRMDGQERSYIVKIGDTVIPKLPGRDWSREIHISEEHSVVVKIDCDSMPQCRNEVVFWKEKLDDRDRKYFAEPLGWGITSQLSKRWISNTKTELREVKCFWSVQRLIAGARPGNNDAIWYQLRDIVAKYGIGDFSSRQFKVDSVGDAVIHDYGVFTKLDGFHSPLPSKTIPDSPHTVLKRRNTLEKVF